MSIPRPTIEDVAQLAGVSRATASRVINNVPGASAPSRERVHAAVTELGYQPNETARALATGRQRAIDVIVVAADPGVGWLGTHPYVSRVLAGVMPVLQSVNAQLKLHAVRQDTAADVLDDIASNTTLGAIFAETTPDLAARFYRRCRRTVSMVRTDSPVPALQADNVGGADEAVSRLHQLGHRRIAAIHGPTLNPCAVDRRTGYLRATQRLGLADLSADGQFRREGGYRAAQQLLENHPDIDALFVACDLMAAGAVQAITASGRRVPDDISIIGFDDSIAAVCSNPPLTTMRLPVEEMAATAARLLLSGGPARGHLQHFPVNLVVRESTRELHEWPPSGSPVARPALNTEDGARGRAGDRAGAHGHAGDHADARRHAGDHADAHGHAGDRAGAPLHRVRDVEVDLPRAGMVGVLNVCPAPASQEAADSGDGERLEGRRVSGPR